MNMIEFISIVSFGLACFGIGYSIGKDMKRT